MKKTIFLAIFFCFTNLALAAQTDYLRYTYSFTDGTPSSLGVFKDIIPRYEDLKKDQNQYKNYDEFLNYLFTQAPQLRENYVLLHSSESQQLSSLEHPRVLLFGGGMAFGLSDHPAQKSKRVEIMQVDPDTFKISTHEIVFAEKQVEFRDQPQSCQTCHGLPAKPLWNPYDFWPNAFAGSLGRMGTKQEEQAYWKLKESASDSTILKYLNLPDKLDLSSEQVTSFTEFIHQINLGRWINQNLSADSKLKGYAAPLLATVNYCTNENNGYPEEFKIEKLLSFFRSDEKDKIQKRYKVIQQDIALGRTFFKNHLDSVLLSVFPNPDFLFLIDHNRLNREINSMAQIYTILDLAGIYTGDFSTSLVANDYLISSPSNVNIDLLTALYVQRNDLFDDLNIEVIDLSSGKYGWIRTNCDQLKEQSLKAERSPSDKMLWQGPTQVNYAKPVMSRCIKCHVENRAGTDFSAPVIPFNQPLKLAELLRSENLKERIMARVKTHGVGQMPPEQALTEQEIKSLESFLNALE